MVMKYKSRITDGLLQRKLKGKGAVLIQGARATVGTMVLI